ncbi:hypothetical protein CkaCkLH20_00907 [Colletotrichum karsti]|uniref:Rhodopsin domain-containing protein n=1 Tax=Colletotrichum karsti TaxID=1095194 RepID=A0A9P6LQJ9_9PEZI|nr:uncharacterized protein CkaCkLH20_00907 [Colletotrichum karsti]KAF9881761.1 hypothetical protein CkaCkLH20_00907 [Colletotrichum karsti]
MAEPMSTAAAAGPTAPAGMAPPSQEDFVYSASMARATVAFGAIVTVITTASVVARLYTHNFVIKKVRIDDAWALCAVLSVIAVNIMQSVFAMRYLPEMTSMISNSEGSRIPYATAITYNVAMASLKITFLFQFYQIFRHVRVMRIVYLVAIFIVGAWSITQILLAVLVCVPIEANWNPSVPGVVTCLPTFVATYINATGTMVTDVIVLFLPLPTLWSLRLRGRQIWAVFGVFGIGAIVPVISAGRIWSLSHPPPKGYMSTACWTIAEIGVGVITASLATIRHLRDRRVNTLLSRSQTGRRDSLSEGVSTQDPTQAFSHQRSGSEVDLIGVDRTGTSGSLDSSFKLFGKKKALQASEISVPNHATDLTPNKGSTKTNITSSRNKEIPMSEGAANFLGEFGIRVERTWEVQEIRMA